MRSLTRALSALVVGLVSITVGISSAASPINTEAIVHVRGECADGSTNGLTGYVVSSDAGELIVVTNAHLFEPDNPIRSIRVDGPGWTSPATPLYVGRKEIGDDVAILAAQHPTTTAAIQLAETPASIGDPVHLAGFPLGRPTLQHHSTRIIGATSSGDLIGDCAVISGESGSPVVNDRGELVAMNWGSDGARCYLVPLQRIRAALAQALANRPRLLERLRGPPALQATDCPPGVICPPQPIPIAPRRGIPVQQSPAPIQSIDSLVDRLAQDPRLRGRDGAPGPPGPPGPQGLQGPPGERGPIPDQQSLEAAVDPILGRLRASIAATDPQPTEPIDWPRLVMDIAAALGLNIAIPGGALGWVGLKVLRLWLTHRSSSGRTDRIESPYARESPYAPPPDAGRSSVPLYPQRPRQ